MRSLALLLTPKSTHSQLLLDHICILRHFIFYLPLVLHDFLSFFLQISGHVLYLRRLLSDICDQVVDLICLCFHISHLHEQRADQLVQIIDLLLLVGPRVLQVFKSALQPLEPRRMLRNGFTESIKVTLLIL